MALKWFGDWLRTFTACASALALVVSLQARASDPPVGTGSPAILMTSPTGTIGVSGSSFAPQVDLASAISQNEAFSGAITISAAAQIGLNSAGCTAAQTTVTGICGPANTGTTNLLGLALGPQQATWACASSCTVGDSTRIALCRSLATGPDCNGTIYFNSGGTLILGTSTSVSTNGHNFTTAAGNLTTSKIISATQCTTAAPAVDCAANRIAMASGTATWTFHSAYSVTPSCTVSTEGTSLVHVSSVSTSAVTVTSASGADTANVDIHCIA